VKKNPLRTWLLVACECGHADQVPTIFHRKTAVEKFTARREPLACDECGSPVAIVAAERIHEPMRSLINGGTL
jgi:hypothetical protein